MLVDLEVQISKDNYHIPLNTFCTVNICPIVFILIFHLFLTKETE